MTAGPVIEIVPTTASARPLVLAERRLALPVLALPVLVFILPLALHGSKPVRGEQTSSLSGCPGALPPDKSGASWLKFQSPGRLDSPPDGVYAPPGGARLQMNSSHPTWGDLSQNGQMIEPEPDRTGH